MNEKKNRHRRPLEVFVVVLIAVVAVVVYLIRAALIFNNLGVLENGIPEGLFQGYTLSESGGQIAFGFFYIFVSFAALVIAIGLLWMRRWSWVAFMVWAGFNMVIGLLRLLYGAPKSNYLYLFLSVVVVFILNQAEVQRVFSIHYEELKDLEDVE